MSVFNVSILLFTILSKHCQSSLLIDSYLDSVMAKLMINSGTDAFKTVNNIISRERKTDWFYGVKKVNLICMLVFLCRFHPRKTQSHDGGFETHACKCWQLVKNRCILSLKMLLF